ncbi:hypothetical protein LTR95_009192 [Oleoguttula sp. CCFEE 5521]
MRPVWSMHDVCHNHGYLLQGHADQLYVEDEHDVHQDHADLQFYIEDEHDVHQDHADLEFYIEDEHDIYSDIDHYYWLCRHCYAHD